MPPASVPDRHAHKVAIVTGSGQGIGRGVADRLAAEGAHVIVAEYNQTTAEKAAREIQEQGWKAIAYPCDISDTDQIDQLVTDVTHQFGHIDILVNNAGVSKTQGLLEITPESWDIVNRVNQRGLFFLLTAVAKQMIAQVPEAVKQAERAERSYGKIVNFSSIAGRSGRPYSAHYSATKWAVISITQSAAKYLAPYNINVNAVCPGVAMTLPCGKTSTRHRQPVLGLIRVNGSRKPSRVFRLSGLPHPPIFLPPSRSYAQQMQIILRGRL